MKKLIPTILSLFIILAAIIWFIYAENSKTPPLSVEKDNTYSAPENNQDVSSPSSDINIAEAIDSSDSSVSVISENEYQEELPESMDSADNAVFSEQSEVSTIEEPESSEPPEQAELFVIPEQSEPAGEEITAPEPAVEDVSEPEISIADNSPDIEFAEEIADTVKTPEIENITQISENTINEQPENEVTSSEVSEELDVYYEFDVNNYGRDMNDTEMQTVPVLHIPERNWPDSGRVRRELTDEIAMMYPYEDYDKRKIENDVWDVGEQLTFSVDYGFYRAGTATMSIMGIEEVNGSLCYNIRTEAQSNSFISSFYEVRDSVTSYIDVDGLFSLRFEKKLREGKHKSDRVVDFYPNRLVALNTIEKYAVKEIPLYTQDILSSLYLLRTFDLEVGRDEIIHVYADGKVYPLKVIIHGIEKVKVPAGKFECFKIEPILQSEGIFSQKGKLLIWLTRDKLKLPVKMKSKIAIGSIASNLEKYSTGVIE